MQTEKFYIAAGFFLSIYYLNLGIEINYFLDILILFGVLLFKFKKMTISKSSFNLLIVLLIFSIYSSMIYLYTQPTTFFIILKSLRLIFSFLFLAFLINTSKLSSQVMVHMLFYISLVHVVCIPLQIIFPEFKTIVASIVNYETKFLDLRAFGLVSGYDTAGFLCLFTLIFSLALFLDKKEYKFIFASLMCILGAAFTARFAILGSIIIMILFSIKLMQTGNKKLSVGILSVIFIIIGIFAPIVMSIKELSFLIDYFYSDSFSDIRYSYSSTSIFDTFSEMSYISDSEADMLLGTGNDILDKSDIGYFRLFHMYGIFGNIIIFVFYFYITYFTFLFESNRKVTKMIRTLLIIIIFLTVLYNWKMASIFSRTFFEYMIILYFLMLKSNKEQTDAQL